MITIGVMIMLGIEPVVANGTNRIGVLVGGASGAMAFKSEKLTDLRQSIVLGLWAVPGAIIGSLYSIEISNLLFTRILAVVMIVLLVTMFIPYKTHEALIKKTTNSWFIYPAMFVVGLYGGFIQVGVGFLLMASIRHLMCYDLLRTNMHKVFVVLIYTIPVLCVFGISGKIDWWYAFIMACGNFVGARISVKLAVKKGDKVVKMILAIAIILMAAKFLLTF